MLGIIIGVMLITSVIAVQIGTIFTQEQLDSFDIDNMNLDSAYLRNNQGEILYSCQKGTCHFYFKIITSEKYNNESLIGQGFTGQYEVMEVITKVSVKVNTYKKIKQKYGLEEAKKQLKNYLIDKGQKLIEKEKRKLKSWQTQEEEDFSEFVDGLVI